MASNGAAESSQETIQITVQTLDSQKFGLPVNKHVPIPELKEQIAVTTGVQPGQQRLIYRGRVLQDDQLLSAYHVEDGHVLHLVVREQGSSSRPQATGETSSSGNNPVDEVIRRMVIGAFNVPEQGGGFSDLNQQLPEQLPTARGPNGPRNSSSQQSRQPAPTPVIPYTLTNLIYYLAGLRHEFIANADGLNITVEDVGFSEEIRQHLRTLCHHESRGIHIPGLLEVLSSTRQLLLNQAAECLTDLVDAMRYQTLDTNPLTRYRLQAAVIRSGALIQKLGSTLLEVGRAIMTLQMGQTPADASVNAGRPMFISSTGPNPIMVRQTSSREGEISSSIHIQHPCSRGSVGPRVNLGIRIRSDSFVARTEPAQNQAQEAAESNVPVSSQPQVDDEEGSSSRSRGRPSSSQGQQSPKRPRME